MKKVIAILLALIFALILAGCAQGNAELAGHGKRFEQIYDGKGFVILVDTETGVEYAMSATGYNYGSFTALLDSYGNPYIYPAFDAREDKLP